MFSTQSMRVLTLILNQIIMDEKKLKTLKEQVECCLQNSPEARNSDIKLMILVWVNFYGVRGRMIFIDDLYNLPREDNIKRIRANFQSCKKYLETGDPKHAPKYLPTNQKVTEKRGINEEVWRRFQGYNPEMRQPNLI